MIYRYHDGTNNTVNFGVPLDLKVGVRHHIALTHDFGGNEVKLYIDGVQSGLTQTPGTTTGYTASTLPLMVAADGAQTTEAEGDYYAAIVSTGVGTIVAGVDIGTVADGATPVYDADFTAVTAADLEAGSFTEDSSNAATVTLNGDTWTYARIYTVHDILREAELLLTANDGNKGFSPKWADQSGNNHHAQLGSAAGSDSADPLFKANDGVQYVHIPSGSDNDLSTPDATPLDITGDIDLIARIAPDEWSNGAQQEIILKIPGSGIDGYRFKLQTDGALVYGWGDGGTFQGDKVSTVTMESVGAVNGVPAWVRVTHDVDDGASDDTLTFYYSFEDTNDPDAVTWNQLGAVIKNGATTSIGANAITLQIGRFGTGTNPFIGDVYRVQIKNGIVGDLVFDAVLEDAAQPYATFTERANAAVVTIGRATTGLVSTVIDQDQWLYTTDDFHEISDDPALDFTATESFTLIGVARKHDIDGGFQGLVAKGHIGINEAYAILSRNDTTAGGRIHEGATEIESLSPAALADNVLFSAALVRNTTSDDLTTYADGAAGTPVNDSTTLSLENAWRFWIGAYGQATPAAGAFWEGSIMAAALWRRALTDAEIRDAHRLLTGQALNKDNYLHLPGVVADYASTPDSAAIDAITGDLDVRARLAPDDWTSGEMNIVDKRVTAPDEARFAAFTLQPTQLRLVWGETGPTVRTANSTVSLASSGLIDGEAGWIRATLDVDNGASAYEVKFYTSLDDTNDPDAVTWIQLGSTITGGATTDVLPTNATLKIGRHSDTTGFNPYLGAVYRVTIYDGIDGTIEFDADFTKLTVTDLEAGTFVEDSGNAAVVTLNGDEWAYVRPYDRDDLLATAELLLQAHDGNKFFSPKWADRSRRNHHAQLGSAAGADANDPLGKAYDNVQYMFGPGSTGNYVTSPSSTALQLAGDLELIAHLAAADWTVAGSTESVLGKASGAGNNGYSLQMPDGARLRLQIDVSGVGVTGVDADAALTLTNGVPGWIRVALDVDNDAGGYDVTFYESADITNDPDQVTWSQVGSVITTGGGAITLDTGTEILYFGAQGGGSNPIEGDLFRGVIKDGLDGTVVFDCVFDDARQPFAVFSERALGAAVTINRSSTGLVSTVIDRDQWLYSTDDRHVVADDPDLDFGISDDLTFIAVARLDDNATTWMTLAAKVAGGGATDAGYLLSVRGSTSPVGAIRTQIADGTLTGRVDGSIVVDDLFLHSAVLVRNVTDDDVQLFDDGISGGTSTDNTTVTLENVGDLLIGSLSGALEALDGSIMAVVLWRRALTDAEVLEVHNLLAPAVFALEATADGTITNVEDELDLTTDIHLSIDDPPSAPDDTDWINNAIDPGTVEYFPLLTDIPPTFGKAETAHIVVRYSGVNFTGDTLTLHAQIFEEDETTIMSDEIDIVTVTSNSAFDDTVSIPFTGLVTNQGKAVWNGARLRLRWS